MRGRVLAFVLGLTLLAGAVPAAPEGFGSLALWQYRSPSEEAQIP